MARRRKKTKEPKLSRGKVIDPALVKARYLRKSLLARAKTEELKSNTPTISQLFKFFNHNHFICYYCLKELILDEVTCDHKTPLSKLGTNEVSNLCICCSDCNSLKGEFTEEEFRSLMELVRSWKDEGKYLFTRLRRGSSIFGK